MIQSYNKAELEEFIQNLGPYNRHFLPVDEGFASQNQKYCDTSNTQKEELNDEETTIRKRSSKKT